MLLKLMIYPNSEKNIELIQGTNRMPKKLSIKQLWVLIFFIAGLFLITGCVSTDRKAAESIAIAPDTNILRVGVTPNAPPLIFKQGNKIVGLEADFAREFAKYLGKSLRFVELEWEDQIAALLENRIDIIMSGMTRTALREVRIAFTRRYLESGQMALIRRKDAARFSAGFFALSTSSAIGVIKDTTGEYFVETTYSSVKKKTFSTPQAAAKALLDREGVTVLAYTTELGGIKPARIFNSVDFPHPLRPKMQINSPFAAVKLIPSSTFRYVSIRHGGISIGEGNEINGLTLQGVGHGTMLEYIQVHNNLDDGIEWLERENAPCHDAGGPDCALGV